MSSSTEWSNAQLHFLINERKQRNFKYHTIPNKKKQDFWDNIAIFNMAKRYREGTGSRRAWSSSMNSSKASSFSILPKWPKGKSSFEQQPLEKAVKELPKLLSLTTSNPSTVKTPNTSKPVTPTIFSFSQNANIINVIINYGNTREED
ncbi:hypothetical protein C1645_838732 [Glomus cerebriforme]|uniref:Uncharacterized protein n=1 Tax=Glomus cerebriforme TaxID=658196 RepID=A0A397S1V6_9GLOM|nr:hypothetical protein C1645_838732 [Glomus cerebriforme]